MKSNRGIFEPSEGFAPISASSKNPFASAPEEDDDSDPFAFDPEAGSPFASLRDVADDSGADDAPAFAPLGPKDKPAVATPPPIRSGPDAFGFAQKPATPEAAKPATVPAAAAIPAAKVSPAPNPAVASQEIRQLALRAIFGVDHELDADELLRRARALKGIRHVARVPAAEVAAVDALQRLAGTLGFPAGPVQLVSGGTPIEFIREGSVALAVQTEGRFAPGVKETLIIIARELGNL